MKLAIAIAALALAGCTQTPAVPPGEAPANARRLAYGAYGALDRVDDEDRGVACYVTNNAIFCLRRVAP